MFLIMSEFIAWTLFVFYHFLIFLEPGTFFKRYKVSPISKKIFSFQETFFHVKISSACSNGEEGTLSEQNLLISLECLRIFPASFDSVNKFSRKAFWNPSVEIWSICPCTIYFSQRSLQVNKPSYAEKNSDKFSDIVWNWKLQLGWS